MLMLKPLLQQARFVGVLQVDARETRSGCTLGAAWAKSEDPSKLGTMAKADSENRIVMDALQELSGRTMHRQCKSQTPKTATGEQKDKDEDEERRTMKREVSGYPAWEVRSEVRSREGATSII